MRCRYKQLMSVITLTVTVTWFKLWILTSVCGRKVSDRQTDRLLAGSQRECEVREENVKTTVVWFVPTANSLLKQINPQPCMTREGEEGRAPDSQRMYAAQRRDLSHFYIKVMEATFLNHFKQRKCINDVFRRKEKLLKDRQSCPTNVSTVLFSCLF